MTRSAPLALACLAAVGCSALNVQRPTANVTGMTVDNVTPAGFTMTFGVDLTNPNGFELPLTAADYKLGLGGVDVADGGANPAANLPAHGTASVAVPVTLTYENLLAAEQAITATGGNVPYTLDGGLSFGTKSVLAGTVRVPVKSAGTLRLKDVLADPKAVAQNPAAQRLARDLLGHLFGR